MELGGLTHTCCFTDDTATSPAQMPPELLTYVTDDLLETSTATILTTVPTARAHALTRARRCSKCSLQLLSSTQEPHHHPHLQMRKMRLRGGYNLPRSLARANSW